MNNIGITGELTPYLLRSNEWIAGILLCCFIGSAYVLSQDKHFISQRIRLFFFSLEHENSTATAVHHQLLLILQSCLLTGTMFTYYYTQTQTHTNIEKDIPLLLGYYSILMVLYCLCKWITYSFVNWIFFDKRENKVWIESYFLTISMLGFLIFPTAALIIFLNLPTFFCRIFFVFAFIFVNLLLLYKAFCIFFKSLHGLFYLFLYFCTLEILPALVIWKGIDSINSILT